jgi:TatD DNase family protein
MIVDTHTHYDDEAFDEDREQLLNSIAESGVPFIVNIGASIHSTKQTIELTKQYSFVYGAVGIHPSDTAELNEENFKWLKEAASLPKIVAIGEIGLDYYWDTPDRQIQKDWFERQMTLAKELMMPSVIHSRDAAKDTLDMIKAAKLQETGGVIHCFSYGKEIAKSYLDMGFYLGIGGVLTFKNAHKLKEVVEYAPLEQLVLETDCPYLSPEPNRGKRNTSLNLIHVAKEIARIKNIAYDLVIEVTEHNARNLYKIT